jgi:YVTN family beta-propeller protein
MKPKAGNHRKRKWLIVLFVAIFAAYFFGVYAPSMGVYSLSKDIFPIEPILPTNTEQAESNEQQEPILQAEEEKEAGAASEPQSNDQQQQEEAQEEEEEENVYSEVMTKEVKDSLAALPERVYVPNVIDGTVTVIDPTSFEIVDSYEVEELPYHITPSWDMSELLVNNEESSSFTVVDPASGRPSGRVEASFPYNFYYTPDGSKAVVVAERLQLIGFRDRETWEHLGSVYIPWPGVDHLDFSKDGDYLLASSEWSGVVSKVDVNKMELVDHVEVTGALPIDIKLSPDGKLFYVANQGSGGVSVIEPEEMEEIEFIPTGAGAHGLQVSRDAKSLYVSNRMEGSVSVIDLKSRKVVDKWYTGGSPDMFQISPDGRQLWVSGRYDGAIYVLDTESGELLKTIYTGTQPHGLVYFPNPGRFSLGHNGVYR